LPQEAVGEALSLLKVALIRRDIFTTSSLLSVRGDRPALKVRGSATLFVDVVQAEPVCLLLALIRGKHLNIDLMRIDHLCWDIRSHLTISAALHVFTLQHDYEGASIDILGLLLRTIKPRVLGLGI
jgi:hypothetical protein